MSMYEVKAGLLAYIVCPALGISLFDTAAPLGTTGIAQLIVVIRALPPLWRVCSKT